MSGVCFVLHMLWWPYSTQSAINTFVSPCPSRYGWKQTPTSFHPAKTSETHQRSSLKVMSLQTGPINIDLVEIEVSPTRIVHV